MSFIVNATVDANSPIRVNGRHVNIVVKSLHFALLGCAAILSGCATAPTASIPVPVSCVKEAPAVPVVATEAEILAMTEYAATLTTWTERLLLKAYAAKAEAVIDACR